MLSPGGNSAYQTFGIGGDGGGGGHASAGGTGVSRTVAGGAGGTIIYGTTQLDKLFFGSGGGQAGLDYCGPNTGCEYWAGPGGGFGGGIVFIAGQTINFSGSIVAKGMDKPWLDGIYPTGGGGAGGSIRIEGNTVTLGTLSAAGGSPGQTGAGGNGRIAIYYASSLTNSGTICNQTTYWSMHCQNTSQIPTPTATVVPPTPTNTPTPTALPSGWYANKYTYSTTIPHAVTSINRVNFTDTFTYDENGNMTCRVESNVKYIQTYNAENRIASIAKLASGTCAAPGNYAVKWDFTYDGDGVRTATLTTPYDANGNPQTASLTRYYFGGALESSGTSVKKYYSFAGQTIAMKDSEGLKYFLTDHLGSIVAIYDTNTGTLTQQRYLPFGALRTGIGPITQTDFGYTGQRKLDSGMGGIMDYKARFYSPYINRFLQPDTLIPGVDNPQSWNRFSYTLNNPIRFSDPTGHISITDDSLGVTLNGWSEENSKAMLSELRLTAAKLKRAYVKFRCHRNICMDEPELSSSDIFQAVFGDVTFSYDASMGGCDAGSNPPECGTETNDYSTDPEDKGLIIHEFGHLFDHRITGQWGYGRNVLYNSTIIDKNNNYVEGKPIGGGAWVRTTEGYGGTGRPYMQHPLDMDAMGRTQGEDFADMFMNWVQNSFADNAAGQARYDWMDARMGFWVLSSINR